MWLFGLIFIAITALTKCSADADLTVEAAFQGIVLYFVKLPLNTKYIFFCTHVNMDHADVDDNNHSNMLESKYFLKGCMYVRKRLVLKKFLD